MRDWGWLAVSNSEVGVVIDARGRPVEIESDADARMTQITEWSWELSDEDAKNIQAPSTYRSA